jgi:hypothetical protein
MIRSVVWGNFDISPDIPVRTAPIEQRVVKFTDVIDM